MASSPFDLLFPRICSVKKKNYNSKNHELLGVEAGLSKMVALSTARSTLNVNGLWTGRTFAVRWAFSFKTTLTSRSQMEHKNLLLCLLVSENSYFYLWASIPNQFQCKTEQTQCEPKMQNNTIDTLVGSLRQCGNTQNPSTLSCTRLCRGSLSEAQCRDMLLHFFFLPPQTHFFRCKKGLS